MDTGTVLATAVSGGVTGILGTVIGKVVGIFEAKEARKTLEVQYKHQTALEELQQKGKAIQNAHEKELHTLQMAAKKEETESEIKLLASRTASQTSLTNLEASWQGLKDSIAAEAGLNDLDIPQWVHTVRAMVRPTLTAVLWILYTAIFWKMTAESVAWMVPEERTDLLGYMTYTVVYTTSAITLWWFGDRAPKPKAMGKYTA
jgi:hypothetical protein